MDEIQRHGARQTNKSHRQSRQSIISLQQLCIHKEDNRMKKKYTESYIIYIGFMRLITLNFRKWGKSTEEGWRRK